MRKYKIIIIFIILILIPIFITNNISIIIRGNIDKTFKIYGIFPVEKSISDYAKDSVIYYLFLLDIEHPNIVLKQCILESANFKSKLFITTHNCTSMRNSTTRINTFISITKSGNAVYNSIRDCILDYKYWQIAFAKDKTETEYYEYLGKYYSKDPKYIIKLKSIIIR